MSTPRAGKKPGQPTKYKPEYCDLLLEHMEGGLSFESFAGKVRVHKETLYEWCKANPDFKQAKEVGTELSRLWWETLGRDNAVNVSERDSEGNSSSRSMNAPTWIFNMKNRFGWRDKQPDENDSVNINLTLAERMAKARSRAKGEK